MHNCKSKAFNKVEVRAWVATNIKVSSSSHQVTNWVWQVHSEHWPQLRIRQVYRWWRSHTMRARQNLQSAKFWCWWIQLLLFTPTSYDCTRTGRQLLQSVTSNNANNSNDQHLHQIIPTPLKTGLSYLDLFLGVTLLYTRIKHSRHIRVSELGKGRRLSRNKLASLEATLVQCVELLAKLKSLLNCHCLNSVYILNLNRQHVFFISKLAPEKSKFSPSNKRNFLQNSFCCFANDFEGEKLLAKFIPRLPQPSIRQQVNFQLCNPHNSHLLHVHRKQ